MEGIYTAAGCSRCVVYIITVTQCTIGTRPDQRYLHSIHSGFPAVLTAIKIVVFKHQIAHFGKSEHIVLHLTLWQDAVAIVFVRSISRLATGRGQAEACIYPAAVEGRTGRYREGIQLFAQPAGSHLATAAQRQFLSGRQLAVAVPVNPALQHRSAAGCIYCTDRDARIIARQQRCHKCDTVFIIGTARIRGIIAIGFRRRQTVALTINTAAQRKARPNHVGSAAFRHRCAEGRTRTR